MEQRSGPGAARRRGVLLVVAAGVTLAAWACDGRNLFQPVTVGPRIVDLEAPSPVSSVEPVPVRARAVGVAAVDSVVITLQNGDFTDRQMVRGEGGRTDFVAEVDMTLPVPLRDTLAVVSAVAHDVEGNASFPVSVNIRVLDLVPPSVEVALAADVVPRGASTQFTVSATDNIGVVRVGVRVLDATSGVVFQDSVPTSGTAVSHEFVWAIPASQPLGTYQVVGFARDVESNPATSEPAALVVSDETPPVVTVISPFPDSLITAGDSVPVRALATDVGGVASIEIEGVARVGDPSIGTDRWVPRYTPVTSSLSQLPADTTVRRYLHWVEPAPGDRPETEIEVLAIVARATDPAGNVGVDTTFVRLRHDIRPPQVTILGFSQDEVLIAGDTVDVSASVSDVLGAVRTGVQFVTFEAVEIIGSATDGSVSTRTLAGPFGTQPLDPPVIEAQTFTVRMAPALSNASNGVFFFVVTARDVAGNVGADTLRVRNVPPP